MWIYKDIFEGGAQRDERSERCKSQNIYFYQAYRNQK